ncbi:UDP-N-acetylmuramate dehydrogenase [Alicyclobacillaceae bacterium I2511]|nr:UDP-N-acetylmuramate dehydrogenase [Alicyclobacillaceae bacterium I2511]
MDTQITLAVLAEYGVQGVQANEPMARHTTWRIGGPSDLFFRPTSVIELQNVLRAAMRLEIPVIVMGRGSNLLVLDGGIRGLVIQLHDTFAQWTLTEGCLITQSGRSLVSVANIAIREGMAGLEFATGIPGSVGGAVMMNAGAHGGEVKDVLLWADVLEFDGTLHRMTPEELQFDYRSSVLKDHPAVVASVAFALHPGNSQEMTARVRQWAQRRSATQPLSQPNCGSVFRNPPGAHAAALIEQAGLKGLIYGGAQISEKHSNFIVNLGTATAKDVLWLMRYAQKTVHDRFDIQLETEVRIIGESELALGR